MKNVDQKINYYFKLARHESPLGQPRDYGFEARLRASIRDAEIGTLDFFGSMCWRFSLVFLPLTVSAIIALALLNSSLYSGDLGSALAICNDIISIESLSIF